MANIAEGFGRRTNKDFANFLVIAHGSAAETQSHLYVALDLKYISDEIFQDLYQLLDEISRILWPSANTSAKSKTLQTPRTP
jgi:four helix bundle protein